ncbi:MAG: hypothetical protein JOY61_01900, partial [Chloroflexi bacterium]|nr:hypothetical protein [Chloroflexota bacterium]
MQPIVWEVHLTHLYIRRATEHARRTQPTQFGTPRIQKDHTVNINSNSNSNAGTATAGPSKPASVTGVEGFDRSTGTGEPADSVAHNLRLMKGADDAYNARDYTVFLDQLHAKDVVVHQIGAPTTVGLPPHRRDMDMWIAAYPDMRVHNNPYDIQFGQGEWT